MRDIERKLRALGQRAEAETSQAAHLPPTMFRRVRLMRFLTAGVVLLGLLAVVGGGTMAARSFTATPELKPAEDATPIDLPTVLISSFETGRVLLTLSPELGLVCYRADVLDEDLSLVAIDLRKAQFGGDTGFTLFPSDDSTPAPGGGCLTELEPHLIEAVISSPSDYELVSVAGGGEYVSDLEVLGAEPADDCFSVGFTPTYLPKGWVPKLRQGSPYSDESPENYVGYYGPREVAAGPDALEIGFAQLVLNSGRFGAEEDGELNVLGSQTSHTRGEDGEGGFIPFGFGECSYSLLGIGIETKEFTRFAEGLRPKADHAADGDANAADFYAFSAVWPEDTYEQATVGCDVNQVESGRSPEGFRENPGTTAATFALEVFGWDGDVRVSKRSSQPSDVVFEVRREVRAGGNNPDGPAALINVRETYPDCWSVAHVTPTTKDQAEHDGSMSIHGRDVSMSFDLAEAVSATFEVGYSGEVTRHTWTAGDPETVEFQLDFQPQGTGHYLILLRDADGEVFSARGSGLPEGDIDGS